jgi:hypothetical protein
LNIDVEPSESDVLEARALAAYERGRLRTATLHALVVALALGIASWIVQGTRALVLVPVVVALVSFAEYRGRSFGQGVRRGTALGLASWLLPMTLLRPCCANMDPSRLAGPCCTMPACCLAAGACLGLLFSLATPRGREGRKSEMSGALGLVLGAVTVTAMRCTGLFAGEVLGLLGGVALGALVVSGTRFVLVRRPS